jgi:threonine dehydrogenase-like Zn-dependent dehydrogenase
MEAIWLENQVLSYRDNLPIPKPKEGDALIQLGLAGICSTDLELCHGYYPYRGVLGHEFVGHVVQAPGNLEWIGKRVVGDINIACGTCENCRHNRPHHCDCRRVLGIAAQDGCFETYFCLPVRNLVEVSSSISDEEAVFSEPLAAALEIQEQIHIRPEMEVMVIGAGRMGLLIAQTLALTGCHIFVAIRKPKPRIESLLREWNLPAIDITEINTHLSDLVVEVTGSPEGIALARQAVHPGGTIVVKSTYKGNIEINLSSLVTAEITLIGSRCGSQAAAIRLLESHKIDPRPLIEAVYPLNKGLTAFEHAAKPGILKILFSPR